MADYRSIRLYIPGPNELQNTLQVCLWFQAIYTATLWDPMITIPVRTRRPPNPPDMLGFQTPDGLMGRAAAGDRLQYEVRFRALSQFSLPARQRLWMNHVTPVGSLEVNLTGVGDAVDKTADVLDPLRRKGRKQQQRHAEDNHNEDLRHKMRMNLVAEREATSAAEENEKRRIEDAFDRQVARLVKLRDLGVLSTDRFQQQVRSLAGLQEDAMNELGSRGVEIIDVTDDATRGQLEA